MTAEYMDELVAFRANLLCAARRKLRDTGAAEDVVQDTIEAALRQAATFAGRSSLKTWVFSILHHKIVDHVRRSRHSVPMSSLFFSEDQEDDQWDALISDQSRGHDGSCLPPGLSPDDALQSRQCVQAFEQSLDQLPAKAKHVFVMRECLGFELDEICAHMSISSGNCHVILHRARLKLRSAMDGHLSQHSRPINHALARTAM